MKTVLRITAILNLLLVVVAFMDARHAAVHEKDKYEKALRLLVEHDLIKDCPYKVAVKNLVKEKEL